VKTLFVYNKKAGNKFQSTLVDEIKAHLPCDFQSEFIEIQKFDAFKTVDFECLVAIGGDGTVNTVAKRACIEKKILAIIPKGSGDGLARFLGLTKNIATDVKTILTGHKIQIDTADVSDHFFVNVAGTGFEAEVADTFDKAGIRGILGYFKTIVKLFYHKQEEYVSLTLSNTKIKLPFFSLSIANGNQWGNNFEIASKADLQDGLLEIAIMRKPKWYQIPHLILFLKNKRKKSPLITYYKVNKVDIEHKAECWHIDGEPIQLKGKKTVQIHPKSLTIIVPHGKKEENAKT
jgi:YegS/Rv2252/BmrU family lipid kinase